jgi:prepilin-type N-terminal cleavage/methylation domain-containing protein
MKTRVGCITRIPRKCSPGFSLVELLLAVALLLILLSAIVFNFSSLQQNAELEEGATQFESLIRYARAHASNTGRKVRLTFEEDAGDGLLVPLGNFAVTWEPDPLGQPDQFLLLPETADYVHSILDVISVEDVHPVGTLPVGPGPTERSVTPHETAGGSNPPPREAATFGFPPIYFYPDGSCDSSEIILAARNGEDQRRIVLRLTGLTGSIQRRIIAAEVTAGSDVTATTPETAAPPLDK